MLHQTFLTLTKRMVSSRLHLLSPMTWQRGWQFQRIHNINRHCHNDVNIAIPLAMTKELDREFNNTHDLQSGYVTRCSLEGNELPNEAGFQFQTKNSE